MSPGGYFDWRITAGALCNHKDLGLVCAHCRPHAGRALLLLCAVL